MSTPNSLILAAQQVLSQGQTLLGELDADAYSYKSAPDRSSIGDHYRHILEHFSSLLEGIPDHFVDYDARRRESRIAEDCAFAAWQTEQLMCQFQMLDSASMGDPLRVCYKVAYGDSEPETFESTVGRELAFAVGHGIHHFAIVRLLAERAGVALPSTFGVAPSTVKHQAAMGSATGMATASSR